MVDELHLPMGRVDAIDAGDRKLTVQTEFFTNPWRIETKIYADGALKKVFREDLPYTPPAELQRAIERFHRDKLDDLVAGLRALQQR